jgi:hypothetical protein
MRTYLGLSGAQRPGGGLGETHETTDTETQAGRPGEHLRSLVAGLPRRLAARTLVGADRARGLENISTKR